MKHAVLLLLAALAAAQPLSDKDKRRPHKWLAVDLPWKHLELAEGVKLSEGPRSLLERFPYILASREAEPKEGYHLTPGNLRHFLKGPLDSGEKALEAARLFIAGPLVRSAEAAERIVAVAKEQPRSLGITIHDYRPKTYQPVIKLQKDGRHVSFVAFEMLGRARLVHVKARVQADGKIFYEFEPIVDGPLLSWQTSGDVDMEAERRARAQARAALLLMGKALQLEPGTDTAWALARVRLHRMDEVKKLLGAPTREWGRTAKMWQYVRGDSTITFACKRTDEKGDSEPIAHVGRLWSVREGDVRATQAHNYYYSGRDP
ncbi:MAG: hypothetical protein ACYTGI_01345 [Planctomycetota bacterium]|jgi:hypothetical protein